MVQRCVAESQRESDTPSGAAVRVLGASLAFHCTRWKVILREGWADLILLSASSGGGKAQTTRRWSPSSEEVGMFESPIDAVEGSKLVGLVSGESEIWEESCEIRVLVGDELICYPRALWSTTRWLRRRGTRQELR